MYIHTTWHWLGGIIGRSWNKSWIRIYLGKEVCVKRRLSDIVYYVQSATPTAIAVAVISFVITSIHPFTHITKTEEEDEQCVFALFYTQSHSHCRQDAQTACRSWPCKYLHAE